MSSLATIKKNEGKSKKQALPKLINLLGDPFKRHWPVLTPNELNEFQDLLKTSITNSGQTPSEFVKVTKLRLGLESGLRAINQSAASFVLISLSLKPHHLIGLIARNMEAKDATVPVYAQPKLEDLTEEIFGIRTLLLVLPKNNETFSSELADWVLKYRKEPKAAQQQLTITEKKLKLKRPKHHIATQQKKKPSQETNNAASSIETEVQQKEWAGDFISFGNNHAISQCAKNSVQETQLLTNALSNLAALAMQETKTPEKMETDVASSEEQESAPPAGTLDTESDADEFLDKEIYKSLTVQHIVPNPNRLKKKNKKKNKNKKISKK